jgi:ribose 5-phosphate isomerase B
MQGKKIIIASDHAGYQMKEYLDKALKDQGYIVIDIGPYDDKSVDYPDYAYRLAQGIYNREADIGILICGTGIGMSIAVNRYNHIRGALAFTPDMARLARQHNNANVLVLSARTTSLETALSATNAFLSTAFEGGRHEARVQKLERMNHEFEK